MLTQIEPTLTPGMSARLASDRAYSYAAPAAETTFTRVVQPAT